MKRIGIVICVLLFVTGCSRQNDNIQTIKQESSIEKTLPTEQYDDKLSSESNTQVNDLKKELAVARKENEELKEKIDILNESSDTESIIAISSDMLIEYFSDRTKMEFYNQEVPIDELIDLIDKGTAFKQNYIDIDSLPIKDGQTDEIYFNQDGTKKEELMDWYQVDFNGIDTLPELEEYLMGIYTQEMADEIIKEYFDFKHSDKKIYMVYDGYLFTTCGSRGSNIFQNPLLDLQTGKIEAFSEIDGSLTFKYILPVVYLDPGDEEKVTKIDFEQAKYEFRKTHKGWRLNTFISLPKDW